MPKAIEAILLDEEMLTLDELTQSCQISRDWVIERVQCGLLLTEDSLQTDPASWIFDSRSLIRIQRIIAVERDFECNPELAGLVADMMEEIEWLRTRLKISDQNENQPII